MGTWGLEPFENDDAADLLDELHEDDEPTLTLAELFEAVIDAPPDAYFDVDDGHRCVAACELVALSLEQKNVPRRVAALVADLDADEGLVKLALRALPRVLEPKRSELIDLVGGVDPFEPLYERLETLAEQGAELPRLDLSTLLGPEKK